MAKTSPSFSVSVNLSAVAKRMRMNPLHAMRLHDEFAECLLNSVSNFDAFVAAGGNVAVNSPSECGSAPISIVLSWNGRSIELRYYIESEQLLENECFSLESTDGLVAVFENRLARLMKSAA